MYILNEYAMAWLKSKVDSGVMPGIMGNWDNRVGAPVNKSEMNKDFMAFVPEDDHRHPTTMQVFLFKCIYKHLGALPQSRARILVDGKKTRVSVVGLPPLSRCRELMNR